MWTLGTRSCLRVRPVPIPAGFGRRIGPREFFTARLLLSEVGKSPNQGSGQPIPASTPTGSGDKAHFDHNDSSQVSHGANASEPAAQDSHGSQAQAHSHSHSNSQAHSHSHAHAQAHSHSLFSHSHTHSLQDNVLIQEHGGLKNPAIRITWIGLAVNVGMVISKGIGGVMFHSQALLADAVHALSDLIADFMTLATVTVARKPPTKAFPNGFGAVETLGTVGVSSLLLFAGVSMGWSGLITMLGHCIESLPPWLESLNALGGHSHSHGGHSEGPEQGADIDAAWLALGSIAVKEWLYRATMKVANDTNSTVLVANAWHHRIDSLVSVVAVATIGGGHFFGITWLDPLGGLIVSTIIARAGYTSAKTATVELAGGAGRMDQARHDLEAQKIEDLLAGTNFVLSRVDLLPSGPNYTSLIEITTRATGTATSLDDYRATAARLQKALYATDVSLKRATVALKLNVHNGEGESQG